jgi:hypothetical protein
MLDEASSVNMYLYCEGERAVWQKRARENQRERERTIAEFSLPTADVSAIRIAGGVHHTCAVVTGREPERTRERAVAEFSHSLRQMSPQSASPEAFTTRALW